MKHKRHPCLFDNSAAQNHSRLCWASVLIFTLFSLSMHSVFTPPCSAADEVLTNDSIIRMQISGLGDALIIAAITHTTCNFDHSTDELIRLKAAHISEEVMQAMIMAKPPVVISSPVSPDLNDPASPHALGVWVLREINGKKTMTQLVGEPPSETSNGGFIGPWGIGKRAETVHLSPQSDLQLSERRPVFYFYFGHGAFSQGSHEFAAGNSPKDIILAHFTVKTTKGDKASDRVLELSRSGGYGGSSGIETENVREFAQEDVAEGIYKIVPKSELPDGEYTFCPASVRADHRFFTFGVHVK
jgi:hypothetical protein